MAQENRSPLCDECARLLTDYISAVRATRKVIETTDRAAKAGVIDDTGYLQTEKDLVEAIKHQRQTRVAYSRHRKERHG